MRNVSIALLAGGRSRRLGVDKALLRLEEGGPTLLERTASKCAGLTDDLFVVAPEGRGYESLGLRVVADRFPGEGPAGGLITALGASRYSCCLLLGCDYPLLARPLVRWLTEVADADRPVLPLLPEAGRQGGSHTIEVLHGIYPVARLPELERAFASGERQLSRLVMALQPRLLGLEDVFRFDPGLLSFQSVNRPDDADRARRVLADRASIGAVRRSS